MSHLTAASQAGGFRDAGHQALERDGLADRRVQGRLDSLHAAGDAHADAEPERGAGGCAELLEAGDERLRGGELGGLSLPSGIDNLAELRRMATMLAAEVEASTGLVWAGADSLASEDCPLKLIKAVKELRKVLGLEL